MSLDYKSGNRLASVVSALALIIGPSSETYAKQAKVKERNSNSRVELKIQQKVPEEYSIVPVLDQQSSNELLALNTLPELEVVLEPGNPFPATTFKDQAGTPVSLQEVAKGKYIFVNFSGMWPGPCLDQVPRLEKLYKDLKGKTFGESKAEFDIYSVSVNLTESNRNDWKVLVDKGLPWSTQVETSNTGDLKKRYGVTGYPTGFLVAPDGKLVAKVRSLDKVQKLIEDHSSPKSAELKVGVNKGNKFPEVNLKGVDGKSLKLSEVQKNKYVIVDFWAPWCPGCLRQMPKLKSLYAELKDKTFGEQKYGFDIYSVSGNDNESSTKSWKKIVADSKRVPWRSHVEIKSFEELYELYQVNRLPTKFLLAPDGTVIGKLADPKEVPKMIEEHLKNLKLSSKN